MLRDPAFFRRPNNIASRGRGGGKNRSATKFRKNAPKYAIFSTVLSKIVCKLKAYGFQDLLLQGYQTMNIRNKSVNYGDKTSITVNGRDIVESDNLELLGVTIDCVLILLCIF